MISTNSTIYLSPQPQFTCPRSPPTNSTIYLSPQPRSPQPRGEGWLKFFLRGVGEVSEEATATARQVLEVREKGRILIAGQLENSVSGQRLLGYLFEHPLVSVKRVEQHLDCSYVKANKLVLQFEKLGLLQETTGWRRNRRYRFKPYVDLFRAEPLGGESSAEPVRQGIPQPELGG